jgi:hypothetical protein
MELAGSQDLEVHALLDRVAQPVPIAFNGQATNDAESKRFTGSIATPACVKACPADALVYGTRDEMLAEAHKRIADRPGRYVDHVYGEKELGGTSVVYISRVPFEKLGFPTYGEKPFPAFSKTALGAVPPAVIGVGALARRRIRVLPQARAKGGGRRGTWPRRVRTAEGDDAHALQLGPVAADGIWRPVRLSRASSSDSAAAPTSRTPIRGASDPLRSWSGSRWPPARSRWPASSTSSSERILSGSVARGPDGPAQLLLSSPSRCSPISGLPWHAYSSR